MTVKNLWFLLAGLTACSPPDPSPPDAAAPLEHVATITPNLDLLFVIDDSPSMADKQQAFSRAFPALLAQLAADMPNLHLGVVSSDLGTSAFGSTTPGPPIGQVGQGGCAAFGKGGNLLVGNAGITGKFLDARKDGTRNFAGSIEAAFTQMSALGAGGCGFEQTLGAMRAALDNNPNNAGFVRASANLGVIVLSDEDDCSASTTTLYSTTDTTLGPLDSFRCFRYGVECTEDTNSVGIKSMCHPHPASPYVQAVLPIQRFLETLKDDPRRVMFAAVVAEPTKVEVEMRMPPGGATAQPALAHVCNYPTMQSPMAVADPAVRFSALAKALPRGSVESICNDDLAPKATKLGAALRQLVNDACVPEGVDPFSCIITDHRDSDPDYALAMPRCDPKTPEDCHRFVDDTTCPSQRRFTFTRRAVPSLDTWSTVACVR